MRRHWEVKTNNMITSLDPKMHVEPAKPFI